MNVEPNALIACDCWVLAAGGVRRSGASIAGSGVGEAGTEEWDAEESDKVTSGIKGNESTAAKFKTIQKLANPRSQPATPVIGRMTDRDRLTGGLQRQGQERQGQDAIARPWLLVSQFFHF